MMELTRSEAIEQHRDMWDRIFRYCNERYDSKTVPNAKKIKRTILREMNGWRMPVLHSDCYLCEYAHPEGCQKCPLEWGILCYVKGGLFQQFCQAKNYKEAAYFALRIRDLRERIETDQITKTKEVVKILDDYARSKGWNCYFGNLETCESSEILRAVLMSHKEEHPRFVSFYLGNSIETIKKQIEGIRLI